MCPSFSKLQRTIVTLGPSTESADDDSAGNQSLCATSRQARLLRRSVHQFSSKPQTGASKAPLELLRRASTARQSNLQSIPLDRFESAGNGQQGKLMQLASCWSCSLKVAQGGSGRPADGQVRKGAQAREQQRERSQANCETPVRAKKAQFAGSSEAAHVIESAQCPLQAQ